MINYTQEIKNHIIDKKIQDELINIRNNLKKSYLQNQIPMFDFDNFQNQIKNYKNIADEIIKNFKQIILIGIGGSILNPKIFLPFKKNDIEIIILDNIDPIFLENMIKKIKFEEAFFLSISKSGATLETVSITYLLIQKIKETFPIFPKHHFLIISDSLNNELGNIAKYYDLNFMPHPENIGGRFSIFSIVGMLPALIFGLDAQKLIMHAKENLEYIFEDFGVINIAEFMINMHKNNIKLLVNMVYPTFFAPFNDLYRQLIAETLGKGGYGITPVRAIGTLDQHSQLQLYLDGPRDKYFNFVTSDINSKYIFQENFDYLPNLKYLKGQNFGSIMSAMQISTLKIIEEKNLSFRHISVSNVNEFTAIELIAETLLKILLIANFWNINPYGQPAVEKGKILSINILKNK